MLVRANTTRTFQWVASILDIVEGGVLEGDHPDGPPHQLCTDLAEDHLLHEGLPGLRGARPGQFRALNSCVELYETLAVRWWGCSNRRISTIFVDS